MSYHSTSYYNIMTLIQYMIVDFLSVGGKISVVVGRG